MDRTFLLSGAICLILATVPRAPAANVPSAAPHSLRAGVHAVDVTPPSLPIRVSGSFLSRPAERIDGRLFARCLVLENASQRIALCVVDSLMMPAEMLDRAKQTASRSTGIPAGRMMISATHTHSAPPAMGALGTDVEPQYAAFLERKIVQAIEGAARNPVPASMGWGAADLPEYTHCRRWIVRPDKMRTDPFGELTVRAHMHPGYQNPDFTGPSGPVDPQLTVLSVRSRGGRPMALLANYSMHYVGAGGKSVSPDYYGPFAEEVTKALARGPGEFIAMMSQGTSGDQHWMDYSRPKVPMDANAYAAALADKALDVYRKIRHVDSVPLEIAEIRLRLGRRAPSRARLNWAREVLAQVPDGLPRNQVEVYAREQVLLHDEPEREVPLQAIRIGNLGIAAIPNEVFAITGLKIKLQSPLAHTFNIELANGAEGYIPPPEQHALGGYTTWPARTAGLEPQAEPKIVESLLGLLEKVAGSRRRPVTAAPGAYAQAVLAARPAGYWRMDEIGGTEAADATRNRRRAEFGGGVALYLEGAVPGSRAPHFAGGWMRAEPGAPVPGDSVVLWFWNALPYDLRPVTGYLLSGGGGALGIDAGGSLFVSAGGRTLTSTGTIPARTWTHLALVRNGQDVAVYVDGRETAAISGRLPLTAWNPLFVGGRQDGDSAFEGKIDEVAVFDRCLSSAEIRKIYSTAGAGAAKSP